MLSQQDIANVLSGYDHLKIRVGAIASHSALDIFDGAIEEGFSTVAYAQRGRELTYGKYFASRRASTGRVSRGIVDRTLVLDRFDEILDEEFQHRMRERNVILIPNRSLTSYVDLAAIESNLRVPLFGSRSMLRIEDRGEEGDYYDLLAKGGLPTPERVEPKDIDQLCIVKLHHAQKPLERGFFTASSFEEYERKSEQLLDDGVILESDLEGARVEKYIIGPVFNLDFFHSTLAIDDEPRLELLGIDWRFESSLDGHVRLPAQQQLELNTSQSLPEMTVTGHSIATLRESLLERAFDLGERFIDVAARIHPPGIIGPFCLQTCIDEDLNFYIYDVAPRVGGGTNAHMSWGHPYGNVLWRKPMSTGRRVAMEIRRAVEMDRLDEVLS